MVTRSFVKQNVIVSLFLFVNFARTWDLQLANVSNCSLANLRGLLWAGDVI